MTDAEKTAIIEGIKNGIRSLWFSVFPVILMGINTTTGEFNIDFKVVWAVVIVGILTAIDGIMYEWGKVSKNDTIKKGLSFGV